jgi:hypothetical protein
MDSRELAEILLNKKIYGAYSIHILESVGDKYNCSLKEDTGRSKSYIYPHKGADSELDAIEGAVNHVIQTGGLSEISRTIKESSVELKKKAKKEKVVKNDEEPSESSV